MYEGCLEVSGRCLESVWRVSKRYHEGVWNLFDKPNLDLECGTSVTACFHF